MRKIDLCQLITSSFQIGQKVKPAQRSSCEEVAGFLPNASLRFSEAPAASHGQKRKLEYVTPRARSAASPCLEEASPWGALQPPKEEAGGCDFHPMLAALQEPRNSEQTSAIPGTSLRNWAVKRGCHIIPHPLQLLQKVHVLNKDCSFCLTCTVPYEQSWQRFLLTLAQF